MVMVRICRRACIFDWRLLTYFSLRRSIKHKQKLVVLRAYQAKLFASFPTSWKEEEKNYIRVNKKDSVDKKQRNTQHKRFGYRWFSMRPGFDSLFLWFLTKKFVLHKTAKFWFQLKYTLLYTNKRLMAAGWPLLRGLNCGISISRFNTQKKIIFTQNIVM